MGERIEHGSFGEIVLLSSWSESSSGHTESERKVKLNVDDEKKTSS
jgi:hypothetical protein